MFGTCFADINALRISPYQIDNLAGNESVIEYDISLLHKPQGAESQQVWVSGARADQVDLTPRSG